MAKRYIGDAVVTIKYNDRGDYSGTIEAGGKTWRFSDLRPAPAGFGSGVAYDSAKAYDEMAKSAVSFGSYYSSSNRGDDTPDWAPDPETADAIDEAVSWAQDDRGEYEVRRSEKGPALAREGTRESARETPRHESPTQRTERLRRAAQAADDKYSKELQRVYGKRAGDARYKFNHSDPEVERAMHAKLAADKAYWASIDVEGKPRVDERHVVADFNNISDLVQHAFDEGATHIRITDSDTFLYYPRGRSGAYEEARVYSKNGYLHVPAHGARKIIQRLPAGGTWTKTEYRQRLPGRKGRRLARTNESPRRSAHNPREASRRRLLFKIIDTDTGQPMTRLGRASFPRRDAETEAERLRGRGYNVKIVPDAASHRFDV